MVIQIRDKSISSEMEKAMFDIETLDPVGRPLVRIIKMESNSGLAWLPTIYSVGEMLFHKRDGFPIFYKNDEFEKLKEFCWEDWQNGYLPQNGDWIKMRDNSESNPW